MKHITGTIDIDARDGAVLGFSMASKKAFKPNVLVKIKSVPDECHLRAARA